MTKVCTLTGALISLQSVQPSPTRTKVLMLVLPMRSTKLEMARKVPIQFLQRWRQRQPSQESMWATQVKQAPGRQCQQVALICASITVAVVLRLTGARERGEQKAPAGEQARLQDGVSTRVPVRARCASARRSKTAASFISINLQFIFRSEQSLIKYRNNQYILRSAFFTLTVVFFMIWQMLRCVKCLNRMLVEVLELLEIVHILRKTYGKDF